MIDAAAAADDGGDGLDDVVELVHRAFRGGVLTGGHRLRLPLLLSFHAIIRRLHAFGLHVGDELMDVLLPEESPGRHERRGARVAGVDEVGHVPVVGVLSPRREDVAWLDDLFGRAGRKGTAILFVSPREKRMLRAIEQGEIQRVGSDRILRVDVRILAATEPLPAAARIANPNAPHSIGWLYQRRRLICTTRASRPPHRNSTG